VVVAFPLWQDVVISLDGQFALSGSWDATLRLWDLNTGATTRRFVEHSKDVLSVAFSVDNRQIVSGSRDKTMKLWNTLGECKYTIADQDAHQGWVSCVRFSPVNTNPIIVSGGWDKVRRFSQTLPSPALQRCSKAPLCCACGRWLCLFGCAPTSALVAAGCASVGCAATNILVGAVRACCVRTNQCSCGRCLCLLRVHQPVFLLPLAVPVLGAHQPVFLRPLAVLLLGAQVVKVWNLTNCKLRQNLMGHSGYINTVTVSPDGSLCASGGKDGVAMLWDLSEGKRLYRYGGNTHDLHSRQVLVTYSCHVVFIYLSRM